MSVDEAKDCSRIGYYAVMLLNAIIPRQVYLGNAPVVRGTSDNIREGVKELIKPYLHKIRAIITDSPNVMVKMRTDLLKNKSSIRCLLHVLNMITQDIA